MVRLIDADALIEDVDGDLLDAIAEGIAIEKIEKAPTVEAIPIDFVIDQYNSEFVCDSLNGGDDDWCAEHCQWSEAQAECICRYYYRVWIPEMKRRAENEID